MTRKKQSQTPKTVEALTHAEATRKNIPTAEYQSVVEGDDQAPVQVAYPRDGSALTEEKNSRNRDLDPQLVWRGKDQQDWSDLVVHGTPLYIQEKVHPKVLIDDLRRRSEADQQADDTQLDLFADFNGLPDDETKTEFYQHDQNWSNRMVLGDSLQVMASLAEREGLRGKVQCIYFRPALRHQVQQQLPVVHHQPRREGRQGRPHHPRARAGQSLPRHLARRHPQLPHLSAGSAHRRPRSPHRFWLHLRADRR